jgi:hypothetical protein
LSTVASLKTNAEFIVDLTNLALAAPDVPSAVNPILESLISRTAAVGAAYFELKAPAFFARSAVGKLPQGPAMDALLSHGLPSDSPLMSALATARLPLFFNDTTTESAAAGFPGLGVGSLAPPPFGMRKGVCKELF